MTPVCDSCCTALLVAALLPFCLSTCRLAALHRPNNACAQCHSLQLLLLLLQVVGAKACNLAKLRQKLPDWIMVPKSIALPFGTFEAVLTDPANAEVASELQQIQQQLSAVAKKAGSSGSNGGSSIGSNGSAAAVAAAAVAAGSNGVGETSPVALLARARELVNTQLQPPEGMQQVCYVFGLLCCLASGLGCRVLRGIA